MVIAFMGISMVCIGLFAYQLCIGWQLQHLRKQLLYRKEKQSENQVTVELSNKAIRLLAAEINATVKREADMRRNQELQEREFRSMIANVSHDLRTPLTVMKGFLQLLDRCEMEQAGREYLDVCFRHTEELERRIQQFFEYSYWVNKEEPLALHPVNITNLTENIMVDFIPVFEEQGISMNLNGDARLHIMGEEELLKRVLQNLLKNGLQYAERELVITIQEASVQKQNFGKKIVLYVENKVKEGCTLDETKVFQRFYTGQNGSNQSTGLGLSIVKLLVEKMGGEVFAENKDGKFRIGCCFEQTED